jgi:hypothetical protein
MSATIHSIKNGKLLINHMLVPTNTNVMEALQLNNKIFARFDGSNSNQNVSAFDLTGREIWQIQESPHGGSGPKPYTDMWVANNSLYVANWHGVEYRVDTETGQVTVSNFAR